MPCVGRVSKGQPLPLQSSPMVKRSPYVLKNITLPTQELIDAELSHRQKFGSPKRNKFNVMKSIRKMAQPPSWAWESDPRFWKAVALFNTYKQVAFTVTTLSHEETMYRLIYDKSAGYTWYCDMVRRCKDKGEAISHEKWIELIESYETPFWMISPKEDEFKPIEELIDGKIRTFIIPPVNLLYWQLRLFANQNEAMKGHLWSAYGMNPFGGGVNRLAQGLLKFPFRGCMDWSGYDRLLPFMKYIYETRVQHLLLLDDIPEDRVQWVIDNTVCSYLIDPEGDVFYKWWGNNSGSANTTCDNISVGELLNIYAMVCIDESTTLDDLANEVEFHLFGDDEEHSCTYRYRLLCDPDFMKSFAKSIGMEIKFLHGGENYPLEKMSFLGYKYRCVNGFWIPRFDDDKILFSLIHTYKSLTLDQYVCKIYSLVMLSFGTDVFPITCRFYSDLLNSVKNSTNPVIKSFVMKGVPTPSYLFSFYTSCEHS